METRIEIYANGALVAKAVVSTPLAVRIQPQQERTVREAKRELQLVQRRSA